MIWNLLTFGAVNWIIGKRLERKAQASMQRHAEELEQELEAAYMAAELNAADDLELELLEEEDLDDLDLEELDEEDLDLDDEDLDDLDLDLDDEDEDEY